VQSVSSCVCRRSLGRVSVRIAFSVGALIVSLLVFSGIVTRSAVPPTEGIGAPVASSPIAPTYSLEALQEVAMLKAVRLWGPVTCGTPLPMCDSEGRLIAYEFPFRLGGEQFPSWEETQTEIEAGAALRAALAHGAAYREAPEDANRTAGAVVSVGTPASYGQTYASGFRTTAESMRWGIGKYGTVLVSAISQGAPVLRYSNSLPYYYSNGIRARRRAAREVGVDPLLQRIFHGRLLGDWFEFASAAGETVYVHSGSLRSTSELPFAVEVNRTRTSSDANPRELGEALASGAPTGAEHRVSAWQLVEPYEWIYGCSPTSAAMALSYWDNYVAGVGKHLAFGKLIRRYATIQDPCFGDTFSVPSLIEDLRMDMGTVIALFGCPDPNNTDYSGTHPDNIGPGIETAASEVGYPFTSNRHRAVSDDWLWGVVTGEINNNRPFVWSQWSENDGLGHSMCAFGYTDDGYVLVYNTWDTVKHFYKYNMWFDDESESTGLSGVQIDTVEWGGGTPGQDIRLDYPAGGELLEGGVPVQIEFYQYGSSIQRVDLFSYLEDEYISFSEISSTQHLGTVWTGEEGTHQFTWTPPTVAEGTEFRIWISGENSGVQYGLDSTYYPFTVTPPTPSACVPSNISPSDGEVGTNLSPVLSWGCAGGVGWDSFDIYFGTSSDPPLAVSNWALMLWEPDEVLDLDTRYYWRVVAKKSGFDSSTSDIWTFQTVSCIACTASLPSPSSAD